MTSHIDQATDAVPEHAPAEQNHVHDHDHGHGHDGHAHDHPHDHDREHAHDGHAHDHDHDHPHGWLHRLRHALTPHSHDATEAIQTAEQASSEGIRAAWIGLAGMAATALLQIGIVVLSGSVGLMADTLHNVGHAITTIPLVLAFRLGRRAPTARYPHGFRRAEDLAGVLIALVIAASAVLIIAESVRALVDPRPLDHLGWVLAAGLIGAAGNELVAVYRIRAGKRIGSAALVAEGQHARADGLTSLAVVAGVIGVWLGFPQADAVVGLVIAVAIVWILVGSVRSVFRRLMDGVDDGVLADLTAAGARVPGVHAVRAVTARWSGHRMLVQAVVAVDGTLTVESADDVATRVDAAMRAAVPHLEPVHVAVRAHT